MLRLFRCGCIESCQGTFDVTRHGYFNMYFFEVPGNVVEIASEESGVVESCCVFFVDSILEMLQIFFVCITHTKVINNKCEGYV